MRTIVQCKKCDRHPCVCCACGGFMNDWHSNASDCIEINSKDGKDYDDFNSNKRLVSNIQGLCEEIKKELYDSNLGGYDEVQNVLEWVRHIKGMSYYIRE